MQLQLVTISKENFYSVWNRQKGTAGDQRRRHPPHAAQPLAVGHALPAMVSGVRAARITWPESVMRTALVRRPLVISTSRPFSRASWMRRWVGAELGGVRATKRLIARMLPKPM